MRINLQSEMRVMRTLSSLALNILQQGEAHTSASTSLHSLMRVMRLPLDACSSM
jgi:hypothetical protein